MLKNKVVLTVIAVLFTIGSFLWGASVSYAQEPADNPEILVIANSSLAPSIHSSLEQYVSDLQTEGYKTVLHIMDSEESPSNLRNFLKQKWEANNNLEGALLVGDLPIVWFEIDKDIGGYYSKFPIDLYFMDLNGSWNDSDEDGIYDEHLNGEGDTYPEIWIGRLTASPLDGDESELINNYFQKNHAYRTGELTLNKRAVFFGDDSFIPYPPENFKCPSLAFAYDDITAVVGKEATSPSDYKEILKAGYEWLDLVTHSSSRYHYITNRDGSAGYVTNEEIKSIDPEVFFYLLNTCYAARYTEKNYIGGWYIFAKSYGLLVIGNAKSSVILDCENFYYPLGQGNSIGEAFKKWLIFEGPFDLKTQKYSYGICLLGDPTLKIKAKEGPDESPPDITNLRILGLDYKKDAFYLFLEVNEPAVCKYDFSDKSYDEMAYEIDRYDGVIDKKFCYYSHIGPLENGTYTIYVRAMDQEGNKTPFSVKINVTISVSPPPPPEEYSVLDWWINNR